MATTVVEELRPIEVGSIASSACGGAGQNHERRAIRTFRLSSGNGVTLEVCNLGASISSLVLPRHSSEGDDSPDDANNADDCVLGYASPADMLETGNPPYFCAVVGRVANRIGGGRFRLDQAAAARPGAASESAAVEAYELDANNGPNHLHGGLDGFCHRVWDAAIVDWDAARALPRDDDDGGAAESSERCPTSTKAVQFTLISKDGDQGYPGDVRVTATYSLVDLNRDVDGDGDEDTEGSGRSKAATVVRLQMRASLLSPDSRATPINLAQHSYFNLSSHDEAEGALGHRLTLPNCRAYTPVDGTLIPTGEVRSVDLDPAMDFRDGKLIGEALVRYGKAMAGLDEDEARRNVEARRRERRRVALAKGGKDGPTQGPGEPYGFDHNYVIDSSSPPLGRPPIEGGADFGGTAPLRVAGILEHPPSRRRMEVRTDAPGVQVYTANFLDGGTPDPARCKGGASYGQWQGVCLETQAYPDSIIVEGERGGGASPDEEEFAKGRCFILRPGGSDYVHNVEYHFGEIQ